MHRYANRLILVFSFIASPVLAQDRVTVLPPTSLCQPYQNPPNCPPGTYPTSPSAPAAPANPNVPADPNAPQTPNLFAGATEAGTQPAGTFNPNMFGDLAGISGQRLVTIPGQFINVPVTTYTTQTTTNTTVSNGNTGQEPTTITTTTTQQIPHTTFVQQQLQSVVHGIPITGQYSGFAVTDNESPRPVDRVFFTYNYFSDVGRSVLPSSIPGINFERQIVGFEKTFFDGDASVGMRLPYVQYNGFGPVDTDAIGDVSVLFKFAWLNDRETGNVISTGLVVTLPTGTASVELADGSIAPHSALFQPWAGFIYNLKQVFFQGFTSLVVPTDKEDPTIFFNSIGAGWRLYQTDEVRLLTSIVPVIELHLNTPLNHRSTDDLIYFQDQLNLTTGVYATFKRFTVGGAVGVPLVGPRPYNVEALANINMRF
jgi:hypothetical protein